jgi:amino acid adenylation domain-containing protein
MSEQLQTRLRLVALQENCTDYMIMLAGFVALMQMWMLVDKVTIGCPIAGRPVKQLDSIIGYFLNNIVLGFNQSTTDIRQLLSMIKHTVTEARAHEQLPFQMLVDAMKVDRVRTHPLFEVFFNYRHNLDQPSIVDLDCAVRQLTSNSVFELSCTIDQNEDDNNRRVQFEYNCDCFYGQTIENMISTYSQIMHSIGNCNETLMLLNCSSSIDVVDYPQVCNTIDIIERQSQIDALRMSIFNLNYQQLLTQCQQMSASIKQQYIQLCVEMIRSDTIIAVCCDRTDMIIPLIAIQCSGAAYVPIDCNYPKHRISTILQQINSRLYIGSVDINGYYRMNIPIDTHINYHLPYRHINVSSDLSYLIYTSGSTGVPKGVCIAHQSILAKVKHATEYLSISSNYRIYQCVNTVFDVSVMDIQLALMNGCQLIIADNRLNVIDELIQHSIDYTFITSAMFNCISNYQLNGLRRQLQLLIVGGETPNQQSIDYYLSSNSRSLLYQIYGPTETCIWSTINRCKIDNSNQLIGRCVDNEQILLCSDYGIVPYGCIGEICIVGIGVSRGYFSTTHSDSFINNRYQNREDQIIGRYSTIYRTGDVAKCYSASDSFLFEGRRNDDQIKVSGVRIEIAEIERCLRNYSSAIDQVVVLSHKHRLIAFIVANETICFDNCRQYLQHILPYYMIPNRYIQIDQVPINFNGKVDKSRLISQIDNDDEHIIDEQLNECEQCLMHIWQQYLPECRSIDDNYFVIGGNSLMLFQIQNELYNQLGLKIRMIDIYRYPTIRSLALFIATINRDTSQNIIVPIRVESKQETTNIFCIHAIGGVIDQYYPLSQIFPSNRFNIYGIEYDNNNSSTTTLQQLANNYIDQIRNIQRDGPYYLIGHSMGAIIAYEMAIQLQQQSIAMIPFIVIFDAWAIDNMHVETSNITNEKSIRLAQMLANYRFVHQSTSIKIYLFKAEQQLQHNQLMSANRDNNWQSLTDQPVDVYLMKGDHESIMQSIHIDHIVHILADIYHF